MLLIKALSIITFREGVPARASTRDMPACSFRLCLQIDVMLCYVMLVMLCYVMLCYVML